MLGTRMRTIVRSLLLAAAMSALVLSGTGCREDDVEEALGRASAASVEAAYDVDRDPLMNEWVTNAGQTLVSYSRRQSIPYEFRIIKTDMVNAFAAPYGHIYVTQGLLDFAETEDEVWLVLGHEIGHVVARDSIHSLKRSLLWTLLTQIIRGESRTAGDIVGLGLGLLSLRYSRVDEYEADDSGTLLAYRAGYDPHAGLAFFHRLMTEIEKRRPASWEVYFMTHPPTERRITRQLRRPELDEKNVEALVHIAHGYLLRGQPGRALGLLRKAREITPQSAEVNTLLGDAYAARGQFALARACYEQAGDDYARRRLAALEGAEPATLAGLGPAGQAEVGALIAQADEVSALAERTRQNVDTYRQQMGAQVADLVSGAKTINERLIDLADSDAQISDATQRLIVRGNSAVSRAIEPVYALESVSDDLNEIGTEVQQLSAQCAAALKRARAGEGNPEDVPTLREAIAELKRAVSSLEIAMTEAPKTVEQVQAAQSAARDITSLMAMMVQRDEPDELLADQLRDGATHTQQVGSDALQAVKRARRETTKARAHALVARLNLLGAAATPALQRLYDRQVAHFLLVPEAAVRAVRAHGAGYGEAAMSIAAARSLDTDPGRFVSAGAGTSSVVGTAMERGAAIANANVLLKFLAEAMRAEREAPRDTLG